MIENFQLRNYVLKKDLKLYEPVINLREDVKKLLTDDYTIDEYYEMTNLFNFIKNYHYTIDNEYYNYKTITDSLTLINYKFYNCKIQQFNMNFSATPSTKTAYFYDCTISILIESNNKVNLFMYNSVIDRIILKNINLFEPSMYLTDFSVSNYKVDNNSSHVIDLSRTKLKSLKILNSDSGTNVKSTILIPYTTTSIQITMPSYHLTLLQDGFNPKYKEGGYEKLLIQAYDIYGLSLPLYFNPNNWNNSSTFSILISSSTYTINNLKCYPSLFAGLTSFYTNAGDNFIFNLHLIDYNSQPNDSAGSYKADTQNSSSVNKTLTIFNFTCECSILNLTSFTDLIKNLMGNNFSVNIINSPF